MKRLLPSLIALIALGISNESFGQLITFQETALFNRHHTGYSIVTDTSGGRDNYLMAGTIMDPGQADSLDIHVVYTDDIGNILWQRKYDTGENERCLNVSLDTNGYVLTGFTDTSSTNHQVFALIIDQLGNVVDEGRYESPFPGQTHGLSIEPTLDDGYIIVGFLASGYLNADPKKSFVLKLDANLDPVWSRYFNTPWDIHIDMDMAESVVEIPGQGYFVSGSVNIKKFAFGSPTYNFTDQGVLALMLDFNGNLLWNSSFCVQNSTTTGHWNLGVRPYFDAGSNQIYLMANNTQTHQFNITVFDLAGNITNNWDYNFLLTGIAGFDLLESNNSSTLTACGLATYTDFGLDGSWYTFNYPPFLMEFDKSNGNMIWGNMYKVPSEYYGTFANGFFTPIPGQQPQLFTPNMVTKSEDGGYAIAGIRSNASSYFDLEIIKTDQQGQSPCPFDTLAFIPISTNRFISDSITIDSGFTAAPVSFLPDALPYSTDFCADPDTCYCEISPSFSSSTTDSCTYSFTDLSLVDSCFNICGWSWDFGDGTTSALQNPTHTYDTIGWHTVCLSVDACEYPGVVGCDTLFCDSIYVSCDTCFCEFAPHFGFTTSDSCTYTFTDYSTVDTCFDICTWNWSFGDGGSSPFPNPTHTFALPGSYEVCLQASACDSVGIAVCDTVYCDTVHVPCPLVTDIASYGEDELKVSIQPNPFSEYSTIQLSRELKQGRLILIDHLGRKVDEFELKYSIGRLNRNGLSSGVYWLSIVENGEVIYTGKLAIQ